MIIAIDGPAGSGKSTIAKLLAERLGYQYIDTGAMYRAVTLALLRYKNYSDLDSNEQLLDKVLDAKLAAEMILNLEISLDGKKVFLNSLDVSADIRSPLVSNNVAQVAAIGIVRKDLVFKQREMGNLSDCVMDGRDIGTVVFPQAELKVFLTASARVRAERRMKDFLKQGVDVDIESLTMDIALRDKQDSEREISPLVKANDAFEIVSDNHSVEEVLQEILELLELKV
jgi:cytidylate kinase